MCVLVKVGRYGEAGSGLRFPDFELLGRSLRPLKVIASPGYHTSSDVVSFILQDHVQGPRTAYLEILRRQVGYSLIGRMLCGQQLKWLLQQRSAAVRGRQAVVFPPVVRQREGGFLRMLL